MNVVEKFYVLSRITVAGILIAPLLLLGVSKLSNRLVEQTALTDMKLAVREAVAATDQRMVDFAAGNMQAKRNAHDGVHLDVDPIVTGPEGAAAPKSGRKVLRAEARTVQQIDYSTVSSVLGTPADAAVRDSSAD